MTEPETIRFFSLLEAVEKDLSQLNVYQRDYKRVRHAAKTALDGKEVHWTNIVEHIFRISANLRKNLADMEELRK
jgi:hypothetical protein